MISLIVKLSPEDHVLRDHTTEELTRIKDFGYDSSGSFTYSSVSDACLFYDEHENYIIEYFDVRDTNIVLRAVSRGHVHQDDIKVCVVYDFIQQVAAESLSS